MAPIEEVRDIRVQWLGDGQFYSSKGLKLKGSILQSFAHLQLKTATLATKTSGSLTLLEAGRLKPHEIGWFLQPLPQEEPTALLQAAYCIRTTAGLLLFSSENLELAPGAVLFNRALEVVGLYLGSRSTHGQYEVVSIFEVLEALAGEQDASLTADDIQETDRPKVLSAHHQYSCNRHLQNDEFAISALASSDDAQKTHFFLMYGLDLQQHEGLFHWFAARLAGRDMDYLSESTTQYIRGDQEGDPISAKPKNRCIKADLSFAVFKDF